LESGLARLIDPAQMGNLFRSWHDLAGLPALPVLTDDP